MHGVILEHVSHVVNGEEVVDSNYLDVVTLCRRTEHETSDTAEAVNTDFSHSNSINYWVMIFFLPFGKVRYSRMSFTPQK